MKPEDNPTWKDSLMTLYYIKVDGSILGLFSREDACAAIAIELDPEGTDPNGTIWERDMPLLTPEGWDYENVVIIKYGEVE
jgi:hypothetical protein